MMVKVGTPSRYIAMAAPEQMEWVLMSLVWKPRQSLLTFSAAEWSFLRTVEELMVFSFSGKEYCVNSGVGICSWVSEDLVDKIRPCSDGA